MAVDLSRNEFKLGTSTIFKIIFVGNLKKIHVCNIPKHYQLVSLETGDKMLYSKHI